MQVTDTRCHVLCRYSCRTLIDGCMSQVTLFKRNYAHVFPEQYFKMYRTVSRGNPNYFITYGNGKSAARVQSGLRPNGAHRWFNYYRAPKCATFRPP